MFRVFENDYNQRKRQGFLYYDRHYLYMHLSSQRQDTEPTTSFPVDIIAQFLIAINTGSSVLL